jgi:hypothetical protein
VPRPATCRALGGVCVAAVRRGSCDAGVEGIGPACAGAEAAAATGPGGGDEDMDMDDTPPCRDEPRRPQAGAPARKVFKRKNATGEAPPGKRTCPDGCATQQINDRQVQGGGARCVVNSTATCVCRRRVLCWELTR